MKYAQSNYLIDVVMPQVKPTTFKVIMLIARQTWGWRDRDNVELSHKDFRDMTGIGSENTVKAAIVEAAPFIVQVEKEGQGFVYSMKPIPETLSKFDTVGDETISNFDTVPPQNLIPPLSKFDTVDDETLSNFDIVTRLPKEEERKKDKKEGGKKPPPPADDYANAVWNHALNYFKGNQRKTAVVVQAQAKYAEITGLKQPYLNGAKQTVWDAEKEWWGPLDAMITEVEGSFELFEKYLRQVTFSAGSGEWQLSTPKSALKTYQAIIGKDKRQIQQPSQEVQAISWDPEWDHEPTY